MIKHIVTWKLKEEADGFTKEQNAQRIKQKLEALAGKIPEIKAIEVGINFNEAEAAYDVALYSAFESREALDTYQKHPEHVKAASLVGSVQCERVVVDYEV
jgi:hypothetical protein